MATAVQVVAHSAATSVVRTVDAAYAYAAHVGLDWSRVCDIVQGRECVTTEDVLSTLNAMKRGPGHRHALGVMTASPLSNDLWHTMVMLGVGPSVLGALSIGAAHFAKVTDKTLFGMIQSALPTSIPSQWKLVHAASTVNELCGRDEDPSAPFGSGEPSDDAAERASAEVMGAMLSLGADINLVIIAAEAAERRLCATFASPTDSAGEAMDHLKHMFGGALCEAQKETGSSAGVGIGYSTEMTAAVVNAAERNAFMHSDMLVKAQTAGPFSSSSDEHVLAQTGSYSDDDYHLRFVVDTQGPSYRADVDDIDSWIIHGGASDKAAKSREKKKIGRVTQESIIASARRFFDQRQRRSSYSDVKIRVPRSLHARALPRDFEGGAWIPHFVQNAFKKVGCAGLRYAIPAALMGLTAVATIYGLQLFAAYLASGGLTVAGMIAKTVAAVQVSLEALVASSTMLQSLVTVIGGIGALVLAPLRGVLNTVATVTKGAEAANKASGGWLGPVFNLFAAGAVVYKAASDPLAVAKFALEVMQTAMAALVNISSVVSALFQGVKGAARVLKDIYSYLYNSAFVVALYDWVCGVTEQGKEVKSAAPELPEVSLRDAQMLAKGASALLRVALNENSTDDKKKSKTKKKDSHVEEEQSLSVVATILDEYADDSLSEHVTKAIEDIKDTDAVAVETSETVKPIVLIQKGLKKKKAPAPAPAPAKTTKTKTKTIKAIKEIKEVKTIVAKKPRRASSKARVESPRKESPRKKSPPPPPLQKAVPKRKRSKSADRLIFN